jgi:hypothetical protein
VLTRVTGWSSDSTEYQGTYEASWTWFDAVIAGANGKPKDGIAPRKIQANVHASSTFLQHINIWDVEDNAIEGLQEWLCLIEPGDAVEVYPMARYPGWINTVDYAEVEVYCAI